MKRRQESYIRREDDLLAQLGRARVDLAAIRGEYDPLHPNVGLVGNIQQSRTPYAAGHADLQLQPQARGATLLE